jgi:hypothetical protein
MGGSGYRLTDGTVLGSTGTIGSSQTSLRISGSARGGDSGGPILNSDGEIVALLWGTRNGVTYGVIVDQVRPCVERFILPHNAAAAAAEAAADSRERLALIDAATQNRPTSGGSMTPMQFVGGGVSPNYVADALKPIESRLGALENRVESVIVQAETFFSTQQPSTILPQSPITDQKPPVEEKPSLLWGLVWTPLYTWIASLGGIGLVAVFLFRTLGFGTSLQRSSRQTAKTGIDWAEFALGSLAKLTKNKVDDWAVGKGALGLRQIANLVLGALADDVTKRQTPKPEK